MSEQQGWILPAVRRVVRTWSERIDLWNWSGVFHRVEPLKQRGRYRYRQLNFRHDLAWAAMLLLAATACLGYERWEHHGVRLAVMTVATWRVLAQFIDGVHTAVFGWRATRNFPEKMSIDRARRRVLLSCIYIGELILWYAVVYLWLQQSRSAASFVEPLCGMIGALQFSIATMTFVGETRSGPVATVTIFAAFLQTVTSLMWTTGVIGGMFSVLADISGAGQRPPRGDRRRGRVNVISGRVQRWLCWGPPVANLLLLGLILSVLYGYDSGLVETRWIGAVAVLLMLLVITLRQVREPH